jgi:hypothetical protein
VISLTDDFYFACLSWNPFEDIHLEESPDLKFALFILNNIFTAMFVIEMLLKWMALGLHKYFTDVWTILDVFIVSVRTRDSILPYYPPFAICTYVLIIPAAAIAPIIP